MGLLDLFKKSLSTTINRPKQQSFSQIVNLVHEQTAEKISNGLSRPTASTGTPISNLHGAAKTIA